MTSEQIGQVARDYGTPAYIFDIPKLKERVGLGFEFTMRKEFSDRIDGYSDLFGVKHSFAKNTDWYSFAMFSATFEFGKRCIKCNYIE